MRFVAAFGAAAAGADALPQPSNALRMAASVAFASKTPTTYIVARSAP